MASQINIFIAYAPEDEALKEQLERHLGVLKRNNFIDVWHNRRIEAGADWSQRISQYIDASQVILLLISPDFLASDYLYQTELKTALKKHFSRQATVIPVLLRPCQWQLPELEMLNVLPSNQEAVTSKAWETADAAFHNIAEGIQKEVMHYLPLRNESPSYNSPAGKKGFPLNLKLGVALAALVVFLLLAYFTIPLISGKKNIPSEYGENNPAKTEQQPKSTQKHSVNTSAATPITLAPGDFQYERVYSVVKAEVQDMGGGSNLLVFTIGLNFKGIINESFDSEKFRLVAPELNGPMAPVPFTPEIVDSKSYLEKEVKFELSSAIRKFSINIEDKPGKKWDFTIE